MRPQKGHFVMIARMNDIDAYVERHLDDSLAELIQL